MIFFLKFKSPVLLTNRFAKVSLSFQRNLFFKSDDGHGISRQEKCGCQKAQRSFPARKDGILLPLSGCLGTPPLPQSL